MLEGNKGNKVSDFPLAIVDSSTIWVSSDDQEEAKRKDVNNGRSYSWELMGQESREMCIKGVDRRGQQ